MSAMFPHTAARLSDAELDRAISRAAKACWRCWLGDWACGFAAWLTLSLVWAMGDHVRAGFADALRDLAARQDDAWKTAAAEHRPLLAERRRRTRERRAAAQARREELQRAMPPGLNPVSRIVWLLAHQLDANPALRRVVSLLLAGTGVFAALTAATWLTA